MKIGYFPDKHIGNNVTSFLQEHATNQPDRVALYYPSKKLFDGDTIVHDRITYSQLNQSGASFAYGLQQQGVSRGDRILLFLPISVEFYISIAGIQRMGAIPVLLESAARIEQIDAIVKNAKPVGIVSNGEALQLFSALLDMHRISIRISTTDVEKGITKFTDLLTDCLQDIVAVGQHDTALITYTTGSSGTPKGADRTHRFLAAQHYALKRLFPYHDTDIDLPVFPVFALNNIASGIQTVLPAIDVSRPTPNDTRILLSQIQACGVNSMTLAPSSFRTMAHYCKTNTITLSTMRRVLTGGAPISETDIATFVEIAPHCQSWILYGSTEVEPIATIESREMLAALPQREGGNITEIGVNVGKIDPELTAKFITIDPNPIPIGIDITTIAVKDGAVGELIVTGEHVCRAYYNNDEAFLRAKIKDTNENIWHRTGDLGRQDTDGYLWIVGRVHNVVEHHGEYFFPVRCEIMLKDLPHVINAAYVGIDENGQQSIIAVVTLEPDVATDTQYQTDVRNTILALFENSHIPLDRVFFMENIPMDVRHHSKVNYFLLRQQLHELLA